MNVIDLDYFVHTQALCESKQIGNGTRIWAFAHVLSGARIGEDCNICDHVFIENDVVIGDRVTVKCGVQLWDGVTLEDDVFVGPNVTFTNDKFPRSKIYPEEFLKTTIRKGASIGANATLLPGITIGTNAMVGAGSVVTRSVPANAVVAGNPAKIIRYVNTQENQSLVHAIMHVNQASIVESSVRGVKLYQLQTVPDMRGKLSVVEFEREIPFKPMRFFMVYDVPTAETRGEHAHFECHQFLIAVKGSVRVVAEDGVKREEFILDKNNLGLYLPPMTWGIQYHYSSDAILLVFASDWYDAKDYIRDYDDYVKLV